MAFYSWSASGSATFAGGTEVYCVLDSAIEALVDSVSASYDVTTSSDATSFGIYAHFYLSTDTPPIVGTGLFVPVTTPDPDAEGTETPAFGSAHWLASGSAVADSSGPHQRVQVYIYPRGGSGGTWPKTIDYAFNGAWGGTLGSAYCAYGTQPNASAPVTTFITAALIDAAIVAAGGGLLLATAFDTMIGLPILLANTCDVPPPPFPTFDDSDLVPGTQIWSPSSFGKRLSWLKTAIWLFYCECVPAPGGSPPAVPYPQPRVDPAGPAAGPPLTPIVCDNTAICSLLNNIQRQLNGQGQLLQYLWTDTQLIQRQGVPFGYVYGTVHAGLSADGHFTVADILGLAIDITTLPGAYPSRGGDPDTYHNLGHISVGTADGWERSWWATHDAYLILPISGAVTRVGYTFPSGIVATITELVREP